MPISAGVFGMMRTMRAWPFSQRDMSAMRMPATMLITSCDAFRCGASASATLFRICGFTASTMASYAGERGVRGGAGLDAELLLVALARVFVGVDRVQVSGRDAALDEAADQRRGHVAAADKSNFHDVSP